jgi:STAS domain
VGNFRSGQPSFGRRLQEGLWEATEERLPPSSDRLASGLAAVTDGQPRIVLDLGECTFLDSMGLDSILMAASRLHVQGRKLVVCNARGQVRDLLHLTCTESFDGLILSGNWPLDGSGAVR